MTRCRRYDTFRGVVCLLQVRAWRYAFLCSLRMRLVRISPRYPQIMDGRVSVGSAVQFSHSGSRFVVQELGIVAPARVAVQSIAAGQVCRARHLLWCRRGGTSRCWQVGYMIAGMKSTREAQVGDTVFDPAHPVAPLKGLKPSRAMVCARVLPSIAWWESRCC